MIHPRRRLFQLLLLVCAWLSGMALAWSLAQQNPGHTSHHHTGPTLERLVELSQLVTLTIEVADVQQTRIDGYVGGINAILAVKGDVQVGVDLAAGRWEQVDEAARTAVLLLPEPQASRPRLDHDRSKLFALRQEGLWTITPGDRMYGIVTDRAWAEAQKTVASTAAEPQILEKARVHATRVLQGFFAALGWKVEVRWPGHP